MEFYAAQPFTHDTMEPIPLYGRVFAVADGCVTIQTTRGEVVISLDNSGKRKDWTYVVTRGKDRFVMVDFEHLCKALQLIVKEEELLGV